jgi:hypothetical protein
MKKVTDLSIFIKIFNEKRVKYDYAKISKWELFLINKNRNGRTRHHNIVGWCCPSNLRASPASQTLYLSYIHVTFFCLSPIWRTIGSATSFSHVHLVSVFNKVPYIHCIKPSTLNHDKISNTSFSHVHLVSVVRIYLSWVQVSMILKFYLFLSRTLSCSSYMFSKKNTKNIPILATVHWNSSKLRSLHNI